ncbi:helix-turn-helix transcriptional regulator [Mesorhizobium sp. SB112]|uniref:helix-turn-helix transcriptional regulator n=1 Tax=Mesorhizobium sp. SB112 TaxID=3151853 RepID=UPI003266AA77
MNLALAEDPISQALTEPFGDFSASGISTMAEAVTRCRWIAAGIGASDFGLFFAASKTERAKLIPCFDNDHPGISSISKGISEKHGEILAKHAANSTIPCRWTEANTGSSGSLEALEWVRCIEPFTDIASGIAFPVYAQNGQYGVVIFSGRNIELQQQALYEIHGRCFSLFSAIIQIRASNEQKLPAISKREIECLRLTANGHTSEAIAALLKLSVHTANQYMTSAAQKLNAVNRMQAVAKALRLGLIQ